VFTHTTARVAAFVTAGLIVAASGAPAYATGGYRSPGCIQINQGAWNFTNAPAGQLATTSGFENGDVVTVTYVPVNGNGLFIITDSHGSGGGTPSQTTFNVTASSAGALTASFQYIGNPGTHVTVTSTTCTSNPPPSSSKADASQPVAKVFMLSRINGILLNDPGSTSLLNRSTGQAGPLTTAMAGGAMNVASVGNLFGGAVGLGSGLGNAMGLGLGASRFGDADAADAGSQTIQFSNSLSQMRRQAAQAQQDKERMALGAGGGGALPLAYETSSPWDVWVEGRYSAFNDDAGNLDRGGHVGVLYVGGDYRLAQNMIVGALVQFDWAKDDSGVLASTATAG
jgi:hypothetical protein